MLTLLDMLLVCACVEYVRNKVSQPCIIPSLIICFVNVIFANNVDVSAS